MALKNNISSAVAVLVPALFALSLPLLFNFHLLPDPGLRMAIASYLAAPFGVGLLSIALSPFHRVQSIAYRFFMPWLAIITFFIIAFSFNLEDCACWLLGLPVFLLLSGLGGLAAGYMRKKVRAVRFEG